MWFLGIKMMMVVMGEKKKKRYGSCPKVTKRNKWKKMRGKL